MCTERSLNVEWLQVRSFANPPAAVKVVMEAMCMMLGVKPTRMRDKTGLA
jgi:hypothetical protein